MDAIQVALSAILFPSFQLVGTEANALAKRSSYRRGGSIGIMRGSYRQQESGAYLSRVMSTPDRKANKERRTDDKPLLR